MTFTTLIALGLVWLAQPGDAALRKDIDALNTQMVAAFKRDPGSVASFYTDTAALIGAGQRHQGRAAVNEYWKGATMFADWSLETLETGGHPDAPWQYGRSVIHGRSGRTMETYFIGLLRRLPSGELKFQVDAFTRERQEGGTEEARRLTDAYLKAVEAGDAKALSELLDDQFVIVSTSGARDKAQEIADLVPQSGGKVEYFRSDKTQSRGFGSLAITTGVLKWKFGGREMERNYSMIAVKRGSDWKILAQQVTPRAAASAVSQPATAASVSAPAPSAPPQGTGEVVEAVASAVAERYVFPEAGAKIAAYVRERARKGLYARLTGGELADALTRDLRVENGDRHLYVQFQPGQGPRASAGSPSGPVRQVAGGSPAQAELMRRRNYFLNKAERLDGNVGYLEVRRFFGLSQDALDAAAAAMAFLAQTDAIIIDVRYAPGGDVRMVDLLASYFFDKVTPTLASFSRSRNETVQRSTLEKVPGRRRPDIPVYVLTSRDTGSAAEDFAFLLQQTGRATLVGDRTAGAGHMNAILGLGGGYSVSVSIGRTFSPKTNEGWEGTGVQPNVRAAASGALDTAHRLALTALIDKATDPAVRQELSWSRDAFDARLKPVAVDELTLKAYIGQYGVRSVSLADGRLWYQRAADAEKIPLTAVSATEFAMGEGQRFRFVINGSSAEMQLLMADGTHVPYARQGK
jgi:ketosteroid isomerase-like protein